MKFITTIVALLCLSFANASLSGEYTIDATKATKKTNFKTIADAAKAIKFEGLDGNVVFKVMDAELYGPLVFEGVNPDEVAQISFESAGSKKVKVSSEGLGLLVTNSNMISFTNFDFESTSARMSNVIQIVNSDGIAVIGSNVSTKDLSNKDQYLVSIDNTSSNNTLSKNTLIGYKGISITKMSNDNVIESNYIYFDHTGLSILSAQNATVFGNTLKGNLGVAHTAIKIDGFVGEMEIASNSISNVHLGISQELTWRPSTHKLSGKIVNNVITCEETAVYLTNNIENLKIDFNSFSSKNSNVLFINQEVKNTISNIELYGNNIISHNGLEIIHFSNENFVTAMDYNNIYSHNKEFKIVLGKNVFTDHAEYKTTFNAAHSISADPKYVEVGNAKYLVAEDSPCINAGPNAINIGVVTDYDGDLRGEVTEIGADEFNKLALDNIEQAIQFAAVRK